MIRSCGTRFDAAIGSFGGDRERASAGMRVVAAARARRPSHATSEPAPFLHARTAYRGRRTSEFSQAIRTVSKRRGYDVFLADPVSLPFHTSAPAQARLVVLFRLHTIALRIRARHLTRIASFWLNSVSHCHPFPPPSLLADQPRPKTIRASGPSASNCIRS